MLKKKKVRLKIKKFLFKIYLSPFFPCQLHIQRDSVTYKHENVAACCVDHDDCDWSVRYVLLCSSDCVPLVSVFDLKRQTPAAATQHHCCTTSQNHIVAFI